MKAIYHQFRSIWAKTGLSFASAPTNRANDPGESRSSRHIIRKDLHFWAILVALAVAGLLPGLESTITSTVLPTISADLDIGHLYVWVLNAYFLARTSLQPLVGQLANIFGRRWPLIISVAIFTIGSGLCGGASSATMLIGGRAIQGVGAGGITILIELVLCDLVPLRQRGTYFAIVLGIGSVGAALGPLFGGLIADYTTWRWAFYLCIPVGVLDLILLIVFLNVKYDKTSSLATRLSKIDWVGNLIFITAITLILIALSWAGSIYSWSSGKVLLPLLLGFASLTGFMFFQCSRFVSNPMVPIRLFARATSTAAFAITFCHGVVAVWALYFLPVYFQGVLRSTPSYAGVQLLPTILTIIPFAALGGRAMSMLDRYRSIHAVGFTLSIIGFGLFSLLDANSSKGAWVGFQILESAGIGLLIPTLLPAVMAVLLESDAALIVATWSFLRGFGFTWGAAIPSAIFNNQFKKLATTHIEDPVIRQALLDSGAYQDATPGYLDIIPESTRTEIIWVLERSLSRIWLVAISFAGLGLILVLFEKEMPLREDLQTEFGRVDGQPSKAERGYNNTGGKIN